MSDSGTLSFDSSTTSIPITISITTDSVVEYDEVFGVQLQSTVPHLSLSPSSAIVTIVNDDSE